MLASEQNKRQPGTKTNEKAYKTLSIHEERSEGNEACFVRCEMVDMKESAAQGRKGYWEGDRVKEMTPHKEVK